MEDFIIMNLLYIGLFSTEGGVSKNFVNQGKALSQIVNLYSVVGNSKVNAKIDGEKGRLTINVNRSNPLSMISPFIANRVRKFAKKNNIDAVFYSANSPANIILLHFLHGYKQFAYLHNPMPHIRKKRIMDIVEEHLNIISVKKCKKLFIASENQKRSLMNSEIYKNYIDNIRVLYLGLQEEMLFALPKVEEDIDVLFFGRLEYYKGIDILVSALRQLPKVSCTIIGKGNIKEALGSDIVIPQNVNIINKYLPDREIAEYINRAKIFVMPYREATGTQIIQTVMFYGKPIIATDTGCLPEYLANQADSIIVPTEDSTALEVAIKLLITNDTLRTSLGRNAKKNLNKKFDNVVIARQLIEEMEFV